MTDNERRAHHNALERRRRDHIKESFSRLRESVPTLRGEKMSRAQVLRKASEYILHMRRRYQLFQGDIDQLKHQNDNLEDEIRRVETAIANGVDPSSIPTNFAAFDTPIKTDPDSPNDVTDSRMLNSFGASALKRIYTCALFSNTPNNFTQNHLYFFQKI